MELHRLCHVLVQISTGHLVLASMLCKGTSNHHFGAGLSHVCGKVATGHHASTHLTTHCHVYTGQQVQLQERRECLT